MSSFTDVSPRRLVFQRYWYRLPVCSYFLIHPAIFYLITSLNRSFSGLTPCNNCFCFMILLHSFLLLFYSIHVSLHDKDLSVDLVGESATYSSMTSHTPFQIFMSPFHTLAAPLPPRRRLSYHPRGGSGGIHARVTPARCGAVVCVVRLVDAPAAAAQARGPQDGEGDGVADDEDDDTSIYTQIKLRVPPPFGTPAVILPPLCPSDSAAVGGMTWA
jgi:hypothetical protein